MVAVLGVLALLVPLAADPAPPGGAAAPAPLPEGAWQGARWGMTVDEVLAALPAEARRLEPPLGLPDGSVVAVGQDGVRWDGLSFDVRFLFADGKLARVSLRTSPRDYAPGDAYERLKEGLARRWGAPVEDARGDDPIDMRQARWERGTDRVDLKYIPGVVACLAYPRPAPPGTAGPR